MRWLRRRNRSRELRAANPKSPAEPLDSIVHAFLESYIYWTNACEDVRTAYQRWTSSKDPHRALEFARYSAALDHEEYAAAIHSHRTERLRAVALRSEAAAAA